MIVWLDYHGGTHGSFLEYVGNVYIMGVPKVLGPVFNQHGACHQIDEPGEPYRDHREICRGHWWWKNYERFHPSHPVIRITFDDDNEDHLYMLQVNIWFRAGNVSFEDKLKDLDTETKNSRMKLRKFFYDRVTNPDKSHGFKDLPDNRVFEFKFAWFYQWHLFSQGLRDMATFLERPLTVNKELYDLWREFIKLNQGYQSYVRCADVLETIYHDQDRPIALEAWEEAWLISNLAKIYGDPAENLLNQESFPTSTIDLYEKCLTN